MREITEQLQFFADFQDYRSEVWIAGLCYGYNNRRMMIEPHNPIIREAKECEDQTFLRLRSREAQSLMDALFAAGLRPSEASITDATVKAMAYHLEDMRKLVFERKK